MAHEPDLHRSQGREPRRHVPRPHEHAGPEEGHDGGGLGGGGHNRRRSATALILAGAFLLLILGIIASVMFGRDETSPRSNPPVGIEQTETVAAPQQMTPTIPAPAPVQTAPVIRQTVPEPAQAK